MDKEKRMNKRNLLTVAMLLGATTLSGNTLANEPQCETSKEYHYAHWGRNADVQITNLSADDIQVEVELYDKQGNRITDLAAASLSIVLVDNFPSTPMLSAQTLPAGHTGWAHVGYDYDYRGPQNSAYAIVKWSSATCLGESVLLSLHSKAVNDHQPL